jgi:hypothetical protein
MVPAFYLMALPSEPAAYVFDNSGKYVDWCRDPDDMPSYWEKWPRGDGEMTSSELRSRIPITE